MTPAETHSAIRVIIQRIILTGLSNDQNFPVLHGPTGGVQEVGISGSPSLSISMKDIPYSEIYAQLDKSRAYHIRMIDGALLQMCYRFDKSKVLAHRLCVFPAPTLELYDSDPDSYEDDELYADIVGKSIVHVPVRFDFDVATHHNIVHPKSHLTLGQYPNCRIPVNAPISPGRFIKFVLRNFYFTAYSSSDLESIDSAYSFDETISTGERGITYVTG